MPVASWYERFVEATDEILSPLLKELGFTPMNPQRLRNTAYMRRYKSPSKELEILFEVREGLTDIYLHYEHNNELRKIRFANYLVQKHGETVRSRVDPARQDMRPMLFSWRQIVDEYRADLAEPSL